MPKVASDTAASVAEEPILNVGWWPDYMAPGVVEKFERETGIKTNYRTFDTDDELERHLLIGHSGLDVVLPSAPYFARQMKAGIYRKLDKRVLENYANLDRRLLRRMADYDPGNQYAVPFLVTTVGLFYDIDKVESRLGGKMPDSWSPLFDPKIAAKLADCGIGFAHLPMHVFSAILQYRGENLRQMNFAQVEDAAAVMQAIRPYVRKQPGAFELHADQLASGDYCLALTWGGDAMLARARAAQRHTSVHVGFLIPREGGQLWLDMMVIPADAPHPHNALRWLDFLMRPQVIAQISEFLHYANGNSASLPLLNDALKNDPIVYPDTPTQQRLINAIAPSSEVSLLVNHEWTALSKDR